MEYIFYSPCRAHKWNLPPLLPHPHVNWNGYDSEGALRCLVLLRTCSSSPGTVWPPADASAEYDVAATVMNKITQAWWELHIAFSNIHFTIQSLKGTRLYLSLVYWCESYIFSRHYSPTHLPSVQIWGYFSFNLIKFILFYFSRDQFICTC